MLRREDCKIGVEVIAIRNTGNGARPKLSIGMIYTIKTYKERIFNLATDSLLDKPNISLEEVPRCTKDGRNWGYYLDQFKLRDPNELSKLFNINEIKITEKV